MTVEQLSDLLDVIPRKAKVYFEIPEDFSDGDQCAAEILEYNNILNEVVLKWDAPCNYED